MVTALVEGSIAAALTGTLSPVLVHSHSLFMGLLWILGGGGGVRASTRQGRGEQGGNQRRRGYWHAGTRWVKKAGRRWAAGAGPQEQGVGCRGPAPALPPYPPPHLKEDSTW
jgi:hypothetical protein